MSRLYAVIDPASPRHAEWLAILGRDYLAVESAEPVRVTIVDRDQGSSREVLAYFADLDVLTREQLLAWAAVVATMNRAEPGEVLAEFLEVGLPILADGVIVCEDPADARVFFPGPGHPAP